MDLLYWKSYLHARLDEIEPLMTTPWGFICACILIELLARMVNGIGRGKLTRQQFEAFVVEWMDDYGSQSEHPFKYNSTVIRLTNSSVPPEAEEKSLQPDISQELEENIVSYCKNYTSSISCYFM